MMKPYRAEKIIFESSREIGSHLYLLLAVRQIIGNNSSLNLCTEASFNMLSNALSYGDIQSQFNYNINSFMY